MLALVVAHFAAGVAAPALVRALGRRAFAVIALVPLTALAWTVAQTGRVADGGPRVRRDTSGITKDFAHHQPHQSHP